MPKLLPGIIKISGKIDDEHILVNGEKNQPHVRKATPPSEKKEKPWLKKFNGRTGFLNSISSGIREPIESHNPVFYDSSFYTRMNKLLRKELVDNRFLLLCKLKGIDVNIGYPLSDLNHSTIEVKGFADKITIDLKINRHPKAGKYEATCYDCELLLFTWDDHSAKPMIETQLSPWLCMNEPTKKIQFEFDKRPGMAQWILFLRMRLGVKHPLFEEQYVEAKVAEGMGIVEVGSFDETDLAMLKERNEEMANREPARRRKDVRERKGVVVNSEF